MAARREELARALLAGPEDMSASVDTIPQDSGFLQKLGDALATMPSAQAIKSAVTLPGDVYAGRQPMGLPSETEDLSRVADLAGLGMTGGIAGAPRGAVGSGPIRAYHGSPHDFDKFSLEHIGKGEGAQAYGHGLYFAENEPTAAFYRDSVSLQQGTKQSHEVAKQVQVALGLKTDYAPYSVLQQLTSHPIDVVRKSAPDHWKPVIDYIEKHGLARPEKPGRMYEVAIHADPERLIDFDAPFERQHSVVQDAFKHLSPHTRDGIDLARRMESRVWTDEAVAKGIPGVKYLDAGSRAHGDGSRNYVVFDDQIVEILKKYGVASIAALPPAIQMAIELGKPSATSGE
jgi:hypothetical protein